MSDEWRPLCLVFTDGRPDILLPWESWDGDIAAFLDVREDWPGADVPLIVEKVE